LPVPGTWNAKIWHKKYDLLHELLLSPGTLKFGIKKGEKNSHH